MKQHCWVCKRETFYDYGLTCCAGYLPLCRFCADALYDKALERKRALGQPLLQRRAKRADLATNPAEEDASEVADLLAMKGCGKNKDAV